MRGWLFCFFLVSGFSGLVCEVVWIRLAMAAFGVTTPFVSIVLSVFMGGLALGSFAAGRLARAAADRPPAFDLRLYALAEAVVGASALLVPSALEGGRGLLESWQGERVWSGPFHLVVSGSWILLVLLPGCASMGATFPLAMAAIRKRVGADTSFSRLYVANLLGATTGTLVSAFVLIEKFGFRGALSLAAGLNAALAVGSLALAAACRSPAPLPAVDPVASAESTASSGRSTFTLLFATGLLSMAMEVVWVRQFTPFLGTFVYAFALILATYLAASFLGSATYRWVLARRRSPDGHAVWAIAGALALLPLYAGDPHSYLPWGLPGALFRLWIGVAAISAAFGYLTPMLVDHCSSGDPERAGRAYAINVIGCILGPLVACFVLLPAMGERWTNLVLAAPLFAVALGGLRKSRGARVAFAGSVMASAVLVARTRAYETRFEVREIRRDATATAIATGEGRARDLFVNGISVTALTPVTKLMVHLPMAWRDTPPRDALVICFGMGTSFRSALAWGIPCTAVELAPSVAALFPYFHDDAAACLAKPGARIVVDDGRRFLERTTAPFDLIVIDPPPPVEAAASSLLYSREFYRVAKKRMRSGAILQQWFPEGDLETFAAILRALQAEFPFVRGFKGCEGYGVHFLASDAPLETVSAAVLARRMPAPAAADLVEWGPRPIPEAQFALMLAGELELDLGALAPDVPALTDEKPVNEYFLLRRILARRAALSGQPRSAR